MKRWGLSLLWICLLGVGVGTAAVADPQAQTYPISTATTYCICLVDPTAKICPAGGPANPNPGIIAPMAQCFTDTNQGIIPGVAYAFLTSTIVNNYYGTSVTVMCMLAVAYYGIRLFLGDIQKLSAETLILVMKLGGIALFMNFAPTIYLKFYGIMQYLASAASMATSSAHTSGFCVVKNAGDTYKYLPADSSSWSTSMWSLWDCIFSYLFGYGVGAFAASSIASFLLLMLVSMGTGILVFFMALFLLLALLRAAFRFLHVYLIACLAISFLFCIGYMFVPLLLFRNTVDYFKKWIMIVFGFMLMPVMMFAFMGLMLGAVDIVIFTGTSSVFCKIGGRGFCTAAHASATYSPDATGDGAGGTLFHNIGGNLTPQGPLGFGGNSKLHEQFKLMSQMALDGPPSMTTTSGGTTPDTMMYSMYNGGAMGLGAQVIDPTTLQPMAGSKFATAYHPTSTKMGAAYVGLNLADMATSAGSKCLESPENPGLPVGGASDMYYSNCPYVGNILISISVALLVVYIMLSLLSYIPTLASNLSQNLARSDFVTNASNKLLGASPLSGGGMLGNLRGGANAAKDSIQAGRGVGTAVNQGAQRMMDSLLSGGGRGD